jgi:peptidoglycan/LPS O-acetylase OafA/YrhL
MQPVATPAQSNSTASDLAAKSFVIPSLDGIRAVSFLIVFVAHAGLGNVVPGGLGVTIFFFLSGYLITTLLRREYQRSGTISLLNFFKRRALRIFPPLYASLALAVVLTYVGVLPTPFGNKALFFQAIHLANYYQLFGDGQAMPAGTGVLWSLAVEEHFYLGFPLLALLLFNAQRRSTRLTWAAWVLVLLCVLVFAWRWVLVSQWHVSSDRTYMGTDTRIESILWGCVLATYGNPMAVNDARLSVRGTIIGACIGLASLVFSLVYRDPEFREVGRYTVQGLALIPLFYAAIRYPQWLCHRWLEIPVVKYLGVRSYTLYLVHFQMILAIEHLLPQVPWIARGAIAFGLSVGLAELSFRFIEKPLADARKRFH